MLVYREGSSLLRLTNRAELEGWLGAMLEGDRSIWPRRADAKAQFMMLFAGVHGLNTHDLVDSRERYIRVAL